MKARTTFKSPMLKFKWLDTKGNLRYTIIVHLPAGSYKKGCVVGFVKDPTTVRVVFDYTHLAILDPEKYNKAFKDEHGTPIYHPGHVRTTTHSETIRFMKKTPLSKLKATMDIKLDTEVEKDWCDEEGFSGWQIFKVGPDDNPQIFAHMELMCKKHGNNNTQPSGGYERFLDSGSDESD